MRVFGYFFALAAEIKPLLRLLHFSFADDRRDEHAVAPNDGRGPAASRNPHLPLDIFVGAPAVGQVGIPRDAQRRGATKLRPVCGHVSAKPGADQQHEQETGNDERRSAPAIRNWKTETHPDVGIHRRSLVNFGDGQQDKRTFSRRAFAARGCEEYPCVRGLPSGVCPPTAVTARQTFNLQTYETNSQIHYSIGSVSRPRARLHGQRRGEKD